MKRIRLTEQLLKERRFRSNNKITIEDKIVPRYKNRYEFHSFYNISEESSMRYNDLDQCINDSFSNLCKNNLFRRNIISGTQGRPPKRRRVDKIAPILFGRLNTRAKGKPKPKSVKILLDSGGSASIISKSLTSKLDKTRSDKTDWKTVAGTFSTNETVQAAFSLPELHEERMVTWKFHVTDSPMNYDMIIGQDLLSELRIDVLFSSNKVLWDFKDTPFKSVHATEKVDYHVVDSPCIEEATERIKQILDAKYEKADVNEVAKQSTHLTPEQQRKLASVLKKHESLFDGTLGKFKGSKYNIELKKDAEPYHAKPFPVPKVHERTLRIEIDRLCQIGVLKKVNNSQWAAPSFLIPKKDGSVRFINDFRELNKRIKRKPYPIPQIQDMLLKLEGFQYATSLDLNMGYYHIELTPGSKQLCTLVFPFDKYEM